MLWWLNRDYVIKDAFRINKNPLDTAFQIGRAVEGHFQNGISVFFCHNHRTVVLIDEPIEYLNKECTLLRSKKQF